MKKTDKLKSVRGVVGNTPFAQEGWEVSATTQEMTSETILPISAHDAMVNAEQGDCRAWGRLYSFASAYIKNGILIPEPLRGVVSERLFELSNALISPPKKDIRAEVLNAVAPIPNKIHRLVGAKKKIMTVDAAALDVLGYAQAGAYTKKGMTLKSAASKVANMLTDSNGDPIYLVISLESAAKRLRKQHRDAQREQEDEEKNSR